MGKKKITIAELRSIVLKINWGDIRILKITEWLWYYN